MRLASGVVAGGSGSVSEVGAGQVIGGVVSGEPGEELFHPLANGRTVDDLVRAGLDAALTEGETALRGAGLPISPSSAVTSRHDTPSEPRVSDRTRVGGEVELRAPLRPASVRDFVTFEQHVEGVRRSIDGASGVPEAWYDAPTFYFTNPHAIVGPGAEVRRPAGCRALDLELEVAVVLGAGGTSLTEAQAAEAVFGYTIFDDWSARDLQAREMTIGLGPAKGKDFCTSIGPWIVTADELADAHDADGFLDLDCRVEINGVELGRDRLAHMGWTFATMIAYASRDSVVLPGDVLASGTTGGGCLAEFWGRRGAQDPPPLQPGDVVTVTVERLGSLTNQITGGTPWPALTAYRAPSAPTESS